MLEKDVAIGDYFSDQAIDSQTFTIQRDTRESMIRLMERLVDIH